VGQYLFKSSVADVIQAVSGPHIQWVALMLNYPLWLGFFFYAVNTILLVLALRDGELGLLYPIISLTYIWTILLGYFVFHEPLTIFKILGVGLICAGVGLLGSGGKKQAA
jgi:multidrug transporter EmrE-like cation transporter